MKYLHIPNSNATDNVLCKKTQLFRPYYLKCLVDWYKCINEKHIQYSIKAMPIKNIFENKFCSVDVVLSSFG